MKEQIPVFEAAASGIWRKEDELRTLKRNAAELDRKIALSLAPPTTEKGETSIDETSISEKAPAGEQPIVKAELPQPANDTRLKMSSGWR